VEFDPALGAGVAELVELISQGRLAPARTRADELLARYPQQAELWRLLGICALQQGDVNAAEDALSRALDGASAPHSASNFFNQKLVSELAANSVCGIFR